MQSTIRRALPAALSVALVAGALAVPAIATTDDPTDDAAVESPTDEDLVRAGPHRHRFAHAALHGLEEGELAERLADELGLDTDTVQEALDTVKLDLADERLDEAVEAGRLTQEQADRILQAMEEGNLDEIRDEIRLEHLAERLDERVAAGELTREEADEILAAAEDGEWPRWRRGHGPRGDGMRGDGPRLGGDVGGEETSV